MGRAKRTAVTKSLYVGSCKRRYRKLCRKCSQNKETDAHIQGKCTEHSVKRKERHETVLDMLEAVIPRNWEHLRDNAVPGTGIQQRPDLILARVPQGPVHIIDVTVPSEEGMAEARKKRIARYYALAQKIRISYQTSVYRWVLAIGAHGTWDKKNDNLLSHMNLSSKDIAKLKEKMITAVRKISDDIERDHFN